MVLSLSRSAYPNTNINPPTDIILFSMTGYTVMLVHKIIVDWSMT